MASISKKALVEGKCIILYCESCNEEEQSVAATFFCFDCEKYFCSGCEKWHAKFSRNHKTISGDDLPEAKDMDPLMQCGSHAKHSVEFYCAEHQSVFCRLCRQIKHRDCEVKDFCTACQDFDIETEFNRAVEKLHNLTGQITVAKDTGQKQIERLEEETKQKMSFFKTFKSELDELFDRYEKHADEYDQANIERAKAALGPVAVYLKQTEEQMRLLEETKGKLEDDAVFVSIIKSTQLCKEYISKIEDIVADAKADKPFIFHDENISSLLERFSVFTRAEGQAANDTQKKSFWNIKACTLIKDSVVTTGEGKRVNITACCTLANGDIVLCDSNTNRLILMNNSLRIVSDIRIQNKPFDVAEVDDNTVVLTFPIQFNIQLVTIKPGLKLDNQVTLNRECYGIAKHGKKFYICTEYEDTRMYSRKRLHSVKILSAMKWTILNEIDTSTFTDGFPKYISLSSDGTYIFLSGGSGKAPVACVSKDNHVIYKYFDDTLQSPTNVFSDAEDNVLVRYATTSAENKTGLRVIKSGGQSGKDLLLHEESIDKITALHFDKRSDILLVASEDQVDGKTVSKLRKFKLEY